MAIGMLHTLTGLASQWSRITTALAEDGELRAAWERLPPSHQLEWVKSFEDAKRPETKQRRVTQLREKLLGR